MFSPKVPAPRCALARVDGSEWLKSNTWNRDKRRNLRAAMRALLTRSGLWKPSEICIAIYEGVAS